MGNRPAIMAVVGAVPRLGVPAQYALYESGSEGMRACCSMIHVVSKMAASMEWLSRMCRQRLSKITQVDGISLARMVRHFFRQRSARRHVGCSPATHFSIVGLQRPGHQRLNAVTAKYCERYRTATSAPPHLAKRLADFCYVRPCGGRAIDI